MNNALSPKPVLLAAGGGPTLAFMGVSLAYKISSHQTVGAYALLDYAMPPGFTGPPPHWHKVTHEGFYVLEGRITFNLSTQVFVGEPGAFVYVPTRTVHKFSNEQEQSARMLSVITPGGFENYFKELVTLWQTEPVWPPQDGSKLAALYQKYDQFSPEEL